VPTRNKNKTIKKKKNPIFGYRAKNTKKLHCLDGEATGVKKEEESSSPVPLYNWDLKGNKEGDPSFFRKGSARPASGPPSVS